MITEKDFAGSYGEFWRQLLPMGDDYVRSRNRLLGRFAPPMRSTIGTDLRGFVNELGFRLFEIAAGEGKRVRTLTSRRIRLCVDEATRHVLGPAASSVDRLPEVDDASLAEAKVVAARLEAFFNKADVKGLSLSPSFPGCGWLDECRGDILAGDLLFEVKAGGRNFRGIDIRQVLVYCALDFASGDCKIDRVCLVNPRMGVFLEESIGTMCLDLAGRPATDVLSEIVQFVSEPHGYS